MIIRSHTYYKNCVGGFVMFLPVVFCCSQKNITKQTNQFSTSCLTLFVCKIASSSKVFSIPTSTSFNIQFAPFHTQQSQKTVLSVYVHQAEPLRLPFDDFFRILALCFLTALWFIHTGYCPSLSFFVFESKICTALSTSISSTI